MKNRTLFIVSIIAFSLSLTLFFNFAHAATFTDDTQAKFNAGTYSNTSWSVDHVGLTSGQTSGTFTSQVFDGGLSASWNQISWSETLPSGKVLFVVDVKADIWKSADNGVAWTLVKADYNAGDANGANGMKADSNGNLYITRSQSVWKSADFGVSWTSINSDYNGAEGQNAIAMAIESDNDLYIIESDEDVWRSADSGVTWIKTATNMNGANGNVAAMVNFGTALYNVDAQSSIWKSTDNGTTWTLVKADYNAGDANGATSMTSDTNGYLYILDSKKIWKSTDSGVNWTNTTSNFGNESAGVALSLGNNNDLYIAESDEDIWRSIDGGTIWTKTATNINGADGNILKMTAVDILTDIVFSTRSGNTNPPSGSFAGSFSNPSGQSPGVSSAQYFQYKVSFTTNDASNSPKLNSATVSYTSPSCVLSVSPTSVHFINSGETSNLAASGAVGTVSWLSNNTGVVTVSPSSGNSTTATSQTSSSSTTSITATDSGVSSCSQSVPISVSPSVPENTLALCSDGIDNDGDGLIDANDPDCAAFVVGTIDQAAGKSSVPQNTLEVSVRAYPDAKISLIQKNAVYLGDALVPRRGVQISGNGDFLVFYVGVPADYYTYSILVQDKDGRQAQTRLYNANFIATTTFSQSVFAPPTVDVARSVVTKGDFIKVLGYAYPKSKVSVQIDNTGDNQATSDEKGAYQVLINTAKLSFGSHSLRAEQRDSSTKEESDFSPTKNFVVSALTVPKADFNGDNKVDIKDWSIFLSRWGQKSGDIDLNGDGKVDISDLSVFLRGFVL